MGRALLEGWLCSDIKASFLVIDPLPLPETFEDEPRISYAKSAKDAHDTLGNTDIIILAVKPQFIQTACTQIAPLIRDSALILSIAAGQSIANFEEYFGSTHPIIRTMPNTPAAIGKSATVAVPNPHVSQEQRKFTDTLMASAGLIQWIDDESLLNAVTALSGSGPAYVFYLIEVLTQSGINTGLDKDLAETLARQTVIGSAALAEASPEISISTLRKNVTSPGGTTQAALDVLMDGKMQELFNTALTRAKQRGEELNS